MPSWTRSAAWALAAVIVVACHGAELSDEDAQRHFDEAEVLRLTYEKEATLQAIREYREARDVWRRIGNHAWAARAAERVGAAHEQLGSLEESVESYAEALSFARESDAPLLESELLGTLGMAEAIAGDDESAWRSAEAHCNEALTVAQAHTGDVQRANALTCLGEVSYARGDTADSLNLYGRAEAILRRADNRDDLAQTLLFKGYAHSDLSEFLLARANYDEALEIWRSVDDKRRTALTLVAVARLQERQGRYQAALTQFYAASDFFERLGDAVNLGSTYEGIGSIHMDMGQYRKALRFWSLALDLFEEADFYNYIPYVLEMLGVAELALDEPAHALTYLNRALLVSEESGNTRNQAYALLHLGYVHFALGRPNEALAYLSRLLELKVATQQFPRLEADALGDVASIYISLGEYQTAMGYLERALQLDRQAIYRTGEARDLFGIARAYDGLGNLDLARQYLEEALQSAESLRAEVVSPDMRASYVASVHQYYRLHVDLLMRAHQERPQLGLAETAFEASERARARSLMEILATTGVNLFEGVDDELIAEMERLRTALNARYGSQSEARYADATDPAVALLTDEIRELETAYEQVRATIYSQSSRYASLRERRPLTLRETQSQLDADTILLEYALGEERSYLWAVSPADFAVYILPSREEIDALAKQAYSLLQKPSLDRASTQRYWEIAARLSDIILGPAIDRLQGKRLIVVADGALQYVPFNALPVPGATARIPMIVQHEIVSVPSASTIGVLREETRDRPKAPRMVAVLADPVFDLDDPRLVERSSATGVGSDALTSAPGNDEQQRDTVVGLRGGEQYLARLPYTTDEANQITGAVPAGDFLKKIGFGANRAAALNVELRDYRILHFATHAMFNENEPGLSGLVLSQYDEHGQPQDGFLRLNDIYDLRLPAELVVLSACDTALGEEIEGEGIVGIVRGFMYAGSKRVVASFWQVADAATADLMKRFYDRMLSDGLAPAAALRAAQIEIMDQPKWRHPFYWAAFTLQGEWRPD